MKPNLLPVSAGLLLTSILCAGTVQSADADLTRFVDPRIGVLSYGATVIGPTLPFGSVHPSPDTPEGGNDGYLPDKPIRGFSQTHVSGTGYGQYGNILISPQIGLAVGETEHDSPKAEEKAAAFEYQVRLTKYNILAQFTPTAHSVFYQFTFPQSDAANIAIDVVHQIPGDIAPEIGGEVREAEISFAPDRLSASGSAWYLGGFGGGGYKVYFQLEFEQAPKVVGTWKDNKISEDIRTARKTEVKRRLGGFATFATTAGEIIKMKIGVSFLSVEKARENLHKEIPAWDYVATRNAARSAWEKELSSIQIDEPDETQKTIFYTALFHAQIMPRDRTGEFERYGKDTAMWDDHFAIWDTWRTLYPLLALIHPEVVRGTVNSFIERQKVDGAVGDTIVAGYFQNLQEQGGNGVDMIIADAHAKGITGIDWEKAYGVLKYNADHRRTGAHFGDPAKEAAPYRKLGWIPADIMSCSMTLEYAQNDFAAAQIAAALGKKEDAQTYYDRSKLWENLWNPDVESDGFKGFIMPRREDKTWVDYDPKTYPGSWKNYFYEANAWTYSYFAPHQFDRLVTLMGGAETFTARLQHALATNLLQLDNEPSFLIPQLFHYVGRPDLASDAIRKFTSEKFTTSGYPGDDDSGAMSSYYIWSRLGLFPNAGQDLYYVNGPVVERAVVQRPEDGPLEISRTGAGNYVASVTLNGKPLERSWLRHGELKGESKLVFTMSEKPTSWGQKTPPPATSITSSSSTTQNP